MLRWNFINCINHAVLAADNRRRESKALVLIEPRRTENSFLIISSSYSVSGVNINIKSVHIVGADRISST
jgi:hypothetical protein